MRSTMVAVQTHTTGSFSLPGELRSCSHFSIANQQNDLRASLYFNAYSETRNVWLCMQIHIFIHEHLPLADAWRMNAKNI